MPPFTVVSLCWYGFPTSASEVDEARWFGLEEVWEEIHRTRKRICAPTAGLNVLRQYLYRLKQEEK